MGDIGMVSRAGEGRGMVPAALASSVAWEALVHDTGADVAMFDVHGRFLYLSPVLRLWHFTGAVGEVVGRSLLEVFPRAMAEERLGIVRRVAMENKPFVIRTMWRGVQARTSLRPVSVAGEQFAHVLAVCRPAQEDHAPAEGGAGPTVVQAEEVDLGPLGVLTPRELEVLALIGEGLSTTEIARRLSRSNKTVEAHRLSLGLKLKAKNRVELAKIAVRAGLKHHAQPGEGRGMESSAAMSGDGHVNGASNGHGHHHGRQGSHGQYGG
jgi:DNA-binding CsgD family transcriptional regulator